MGRYHITQKTHAQPYGNHLSIYKICLYMPAGSLILHGIDLHTDIIFNRESTFFFSALSRSWGDFASLMMKKYLKRGESGLPTGCLNSNPASREEDRTSIARHEGSYPITRQWKQKPQQFWPPIGRKIRAKNMGRRAPCFRPEDVNICSSKPAGCAGLIRYDMPRLTARQQTHPRTNPVLTRVIR